MKPYDRSDPNTVIMQARVHSSRAVISRKQDKIKIPGECICFCVHWLLTSITGIRGLIDNTGENVDEEQEYGDKKSSPGRVRSRGKEKENPRSDNNEDGWDVVESDVLLPLAE